RVLLLAAVGKVVAEAQAPLDEVLGSHVAPDPRILARVMINACRDIPRVRRRVPPEAGIVDFGLVQPPAPKPIVLELPDRHVLTEVDRCRERPASAEVA